MWRKATASVGSGACVQIGTRTNTDRVAIRDSKLGESSPVLVFTASEWTAFLEGVKAGEFDQP
jgi:hypothetical protein